MRGLHKLLAPPEYSILPAIAHSIRAYFEILIMVFIGIIYCNYRTHIPNQMAELPRPIKYAHGGYNPHFLDSEII